MSTPPHPSKPSCGAAPSETERFRIALRHSPIIVFEHDLDLRYTWMYNPSPKFGYSAEEIIGKTDAELLTPECARELTDLKRQVLKSGRGARKEVEVPMEGHTLYFDLTVEPLCDAAGCITGLACATFDITERKRLENSLEESRSRYAAAERIARLGHFVRDMEADTVDWSPELFHIFGIDPRAPAPRIQRFLSMVHPEDRERLMAEIEGALSSGRERLWEYRIRRSDGEERMVRTTIHRVPDAKGRSTRVAGVLQDVTLEHAFQKRIAALNQAEREAILRDLHDTVCQELSGICFLADSLRDNLCRRPEEMLRDVESIIHSSQRAIEQARSIARNLKPLSDAPNALGLALVDLAAYIERIYGVPCRCFLKTRVATTDNQLSTQLYLIAREAAVNAARHAQAREIRIVLFRARTHGILQVTDDGNGIHQAQKNDSFGGMNIMQRRAELIGAELTIRSIAESGIRVECRWRRYKNDTANRS